MQMQSWVRGYFTWPVTICHFGTGSVNYDDETSNFDTSLKTAGQVRWDCSRTSYRSRRRSELECFVIVILYYPLDDTYDSQLHNPRHYIIIIIVVICKIFYVMPTDFLLYNTVHVTVSSRSSSLSCD